VAHPVGALGANLNATNKKGRTAFHSFAEGMANRAGYLMTTSIHDPRSELPKVGRTERWGEYINWFSRVGADINATDNEGYTPLHVSCFTFSYHTYFMPFHISALDYAEIYFAESEIYRQS